MRRNDICLYLGPAERSGLQALITNRNTPLARATTAHGNKAEGGCQDPSGDPAQCHALDRALMAEAMGISPLSVGRIWAEAGLKPHLTKVTDIVGLYLDPPDRAVVLCVDERS